MSVSEPYHVVELDDACREQQLGEGWFPTIDDVPTQAISMSMQVRPPSPAGILSLSLSLFLSALPHAAVGLTRVRCWGGGGQWILKPTHLVVTCPDERKSEAVAGSVSGPMTPACPGAYLRTHPSAVLFVDEGAATLL